MDYRFVPMGWNDASAVVAWRYEPPYDIYNVPIDEQASTIPYFADPRNAYYTVRLSDELVGFCCFGAEARVPGGEYQGDDVIDVGVGLRPDLTGKGLGVVFVAAVLDFGSQVYHPHDFRLTVATFNQRAIRVYETLGFRTTHEFVVERGDGAARTWIQMEKMNGFP